MTEKKIVDDLLNSIVDVNKNIATVKMQIIDACKIARRPIDKVKLVAVTKQANIEQIMSAINCGCNNFAENYLQEAKIKWQQILTPDIIAKHPDLQLAFIGKVQSNKVDEIVKLFSIIESVDSKKIANAIDISAKKQHKKISILIQVNIGEEPQKSGVMPNDLGELVNFIASKENLLLRGLMAIPPQSNNNTETALYFALLNRLAKKYQLDYLSMGMSSDYQLAIACGSNEIRIGTAIFGERH